MSNESLDKVFQLYQDVLDHETTKTYITQKSTTSQMINTTSQMIVVFYTEISKEGVMRVIIAGSRTFSDYNLLEERLNFFFSKKAREQITIISGTANGADKLGERYANENNISIERYPADWDQYGKSAGYKRNLQMANNADALVAFWDGVSKGTNHMINIAKNKNLKVRIVTY